MNLTKLSINRTGLLILLAVIITTFSSCKKYLDAKPNKSIVVPSTLQDLQAMLDNLDVMNNNYPYVGELTSDDNYLLYPDWQSLYLQEDRDNYIWKTDAVVTDSQWLGPYQVVYYSNLILETLDGILVTPSNKSQWNAIKGSALFFRSYAFYELAQLFTKPYNVQTASTSLGIPLRLTSDIYAKTTRASLNDTYSQIVGDLKTALKYLPSTTAYKSRPAQTAVYGELARIYLVTGEYQQSGSYADSCLKYYSKLIDYNTVDSTSTTPFTVFNDETIFYSISGGSPALVASTCKADTTLLSFYQSNDLRKSIFYLDNGDGTFSFKGGYDGYGNGAVFNGLATDELYLIRAECYARAGDKDKSIADLNDLLKMRWKTGTFIPISASNADDALAKILNERRKELVFRGLRWTDLRRLNSDSKYAVTLHRLLNGTTYSLLPNDPRYVFLIPDKVIQQSRITQNIR